MNKANVYKGIIKITKIKFTSLILCILLFSNLLLVSAVDTTASDNSSQSDLISINVSEADIRDVLSMIALNMNKNIIYIGEPIKVSFTASDIEASKALELFLQSTGKDSNQLGYLKEGDTYIVGSQQKLEKDFFKQMALTSFKLNYLSPENLRTEFEKLKLPIVIITAENSKYVWAQGMPQALAKLSEVINALDRAENFTQEASPEMLSLTTFNLNYITSDIVNSFIAQLEIPAKTLIIDSNLKVIWAAGTPDAIRDIGTLISKVDVPSSEVTSDILAESSMERYKMTYLTFEKLAPVVGQLALNGQIFNTNLNDKTIWIKGTASEIEEIKKVIATLDTLDNNEKNRFFIHNLRYVSAADAALRLEFLSVSNVKTFTLNYPQFSKELMISCPQDMVDTVTSLLNEIDVEGDRIRVPVDYSNEIGGKDRLLTRRTIVNIMTGIALDDIHVTDNISRNKSEYYYMMWIEETPDNIKRARDLIASIDAP